MFTYADLKEEIEKMSLEDLKKPVQVHVDIVTSTSGEPYDTGYVADYIMYDVGAEGIPTLFCSLSNGESSEDEWEDGPVDNDPPLDIELLEEIED